MASACGLQAAICVSGKLRTLVALIFGCMAKIIGISGVFYKIIGKAASAIDDLTGTLAPYDRFVVFGPIELDQVVRSIEVGRDRKHFLH